VKQHPGRYAAGNGIRPTRPDDPLTAAIDRLLGALSAVLRGYQLDPSQEIHALRMLRTMLHGFATLEVDGGFRFDTDIDDSFTWMVDLIDHGLQSAQGSSASPHRSSGPFEPSSVDAVRNTEDPP
jgi:Tetracyclin repressor-like, C-terminal domain